MKGSNTPAGVALSTKYVPGTAQVRVFVPGFVNAKQMYVTEGEWPPQQGCAVEVDGRWGYVATGQSDKTGTVRLEDQISPAS